MDLMEQSASTLSRLIARRELSPVELMQAHLARVAAANGAVNAVVSPRDPEVLLAEARAAEAELTKTGPQGWLHGIPMALKDLVAVKGLRSTYGSPLFADFVPAADDLVAARLRAAGAIFTGKTNTPEWGHGSHSFNPVHGVTRNPYDLSRSAGGSSGGAAAAVACGLLHAVPVTLGHRHRCIRLSARATLREVAVPETVFGAVREAAVGGGHPVAGVHALVACRGAQAFQRRAASGVNAVDPIQP